ncbi:c-type cytochrome [Pelomonas sp. KK5]|uniref:c-type cytochrome n=1 Tax=Pelomonas sp. KK5 TaxID=1855730 RepID=UPI00097CAAB7|nr:c-type cytochrome [Pelomonas sp. KK5]
MQRAVFRWVGVGLLVLGSHAAPARAQVADTMAQRMQACVVCHGKEGRPAAAGVYFPRIAGKPAGYLYQQLKNFQQGRRHNEAMERLLRNLSDDYLREIAGYFAALDLPYPPAQAHGLSDAQRQAAEQLVSKGAPERRIPACVACHGAAMAGRQPAMPGLLTLPAGYLKAQLDGWRDGTRQAQAPDCMATVARSLSADEAAWVARWLSAQTLPTGTKPQPASAEPLPLRCGSNP